LTERLSVDSQLNQGGLLFSVTDGLSSSCRNAETIPFVFGKEWGLAEVAEEFEWYISFGAKNFDTQGKT
jgi:hypothetical protein